VDVQHHVHARHLHVRDEPLLHPTEARDLQRRVQDERMSFGSSLPVAFHALRAFDLRLRRIRGLVGDF
jgi:hypothetical protein